MLLSLYAEDRPFRGDLIVAKEGAEDLHNMTPLRMALSYLNFKRARQPPPELGGIVMPVRLQTPTGRQDGNGPSFFSLHRSVDQAGLKFRDLAVFAS